MIDGQSMNGCVGTTRILPEQQLKNTRFQVFVSDLFGDSVVSTVVHGRITGIGRFGFLAHVHAILWRSIIPYSNIHTLFSTTVFPVNYDHILKYVYDTGMAPSCAGETTDGQSITATYVRKSHTVF